MFSKLLSVLISYFIGKLTSSHQEHGFFPTIPMGVVKRVVTLVTAAAVAVFLIVAGTFTVLVDLVLATRAEGALALTQASIVGFALVGVSALSLFLFVFKDSAWKVEIEKSESDTPSPLTEALADLVRDFTQERKFRRDYGSVDEETAMENAAAAGSSQYRPNPPLHM